MKRTEPEESRNNLSSFPCELLSNATVGGDDESPEIKIFDLQVMSDGDVEISQSRGVEGQDLTDVVEPVEGDNRDDSHFIVNLLLCENSDVLDDCGLQQLIENDPVKFGTVLEGESVIEFEKVTASHITESVTLLDKVVEFEKVNQTSTPVRAAVW